MSKRDVMDTQDTVFDWLRDAHAMERQSIKIFEDLAERLEHYPELRARVEKHIFETRGQADAIKARLKDHDEAPSTIKDLTAKMAAAYQSTAGKFVDDEVVKAVLGAHSFVHMKIASYRILIAGAQTLRDDKTVEFCQLSLQKEVAMGEWLSEHLTAITNEYLSRSLSPIHQAKR